MRKLAFTLIFMFSCASGERYFSVNNVEVRVQAENSYIAQQRAQNSAMFKAFSKMLKAEFPGLAVPARFPFSDVSGCMDDYSIDREKFSKTVFVGKFSFRFSRERVLKLLQRYGVAVSAEHSDSAPVRFITARSDFMRNSVYLMRNSAVVEKFNAGKVVFSVNKDSAGKIESKIVCVKL